MSTTELETIPQEAQEQIRQVGSQVKLIITKANELTVSNPDEHARASAFLVDLKEAFNEIETSRKDLVDPLNQTVKKINSAYKMRTEPLQEAERMIKGKVSAYVTEQERIAAEAAEKKEQERKEQEDAARKAAEAAEAALAKAQSSGDANAATEAATRAEEASAALEQVSLPQAMEKPSTSCRTEFGSTHTRKVWKFEVSDPAAVPPEYLMVDEKKIGQAVRAGAREIAGVRIYQENQVSVR